MNVENRKLFANRDARKRLAEMGGILASSPELMGEAMKFANGGTARERAISGQGALDQFASSGMRPLDFSFRDLDRDLGSEMQALDDRVQGRIVSFLGNLFEVVGDKIFHTESGVEIEEPNLKAEILTQGDRIAGEDLAMAVPFPQGQARNYTQLVSDIENPIERGRALLAASSPEVELENAPITSMNRIAGEDLAMAVPFPQGQTRNYTQPAVADNQGIPMEDASSALAGMTMPTPAETLMSMTPEEDPASLRQIQVQGMPFLVDERTNQVFTMDMDPILSTDARSKMVTEFMSSAEFKQQEAERLKSEASIAQQQQQKVVEDQTFGGVPLSSEAAADLAAAEKRVSEASEAASAATEGDILTRAQEMADAEREQMTGMPDLAAPEKVDVDALLEAAKENNPAAVTEALKKRFMDRDSDIVPSTVDQLTKEPPKGAPDDDTPDAPKPDAPKTRKQRMLESVDMVSELFGIREKDKAEDMYDLMATIGFAMASGESPNAMKNIADAFLVGAQMKRADKKEDKKLDQAIRTLAVKDVLEQESDERALTQLLAKETRQDSRALDLYAEKLRIKEKMDPTSPAGRYLSSELGDAILGVYADVLKDQTINPDDKGAEFFNRVGDKNATQFLGLTGFSAMGGGVGAGVTPTKTTLDFGESD